MDAKKDSSKKSDQKKMSLDAEKLAFTIADLQITEEVFKDDKETRQKRKEKRDRESLEEALRVFEPSKQYLDPNQRKNMTEEDKEVEMFKQWCIDSEAWAADFKKRTGN